MNTNMASKIATVCYAAVVTLAVSAPAAAQRSRYEVTLYNESEVTFHSVHVSSVYDRSWEGDLLGSDTLPPGYHFTVEVPAGRWDFRFMDRYGNSCILHNVIVDRNAAVEVTNEWLASYCTFQLSRR